MTQATAPSELLREAARRIREHAQGARHWPWIAPRSVPNPSVRTERGSEIAFMTYADDQATADYIALVHPGVALAVADWLEDEAATVDAVENAATAGTHFVYRGGPALAVARLVLGERGA